MEQTNNTIINKASGTPTFPHKRSGVFKWLLALSIAIVANLFATYAIDIFYPQPQFENFCEQKQVKPAVLTKEACMSVGGQWSEDVYEGVPVKGSVRTEAPTPAVPPSEQAPQVRGYCNEQYTCGKAYEEANKVYQRNVFVGMIIVGTLLLIGGLFLVGLEAVALGLSFGGVFAFIIGTTRYWSNMDERLRVVVLGVALAALLWVGVKKFRE